jgi:imidazoleglycerol-phosphate dehydratase
MARATIERKTKETEIRLTLDLERRDAPRVSTGVPFFDHMLTAMAFHGGFWIDLEATGDLDVDAHHLVEDTGLVLGDAFRKVQDARGGVMRYGHSVIPMDEALSEVVIDACGRPYWVYAATFPQTHAGTFDLSLVREFLIGFTNRAQVNLHAHCRYGANGHHMVEALFKALGKALAQAYAPRDGGSAAMSTKGVI